METQIRTVAKTISWRIFGTLITASVVGLITGKAELGLSIGTLDCVLKLFAYYFHERIWNTIRFGYENTQPRSGKVEFDAVALPVHLVAEQYR